MHIDAVNGDDATTVSIKPKKWYRRILDLFNAFPNKKTGIKDYYLCKMTSMYSRAFRTALLIALCLKIFNEVVNVMQFSLIPRPEYARSAKMVVIFIFSAMLFGRFINNNPYTLKVFLITVILLEFCISIFEFYVIEDYKTTITYPIS